VAGNLEDAKTQWKKLKRMKFPVNKHSAAHLGNKRKLLKMLLERVEEENEAETTTPMANIIRITSVSKTQEPYRSGRSSR
jgi:hypothetical protein